MRKIALLNRPMFRRLSDGEGHHANESDGPSKSELYVATLMEAASTTAEQHGLLEKMLSDVGEQLSRRMEKGTRKRAELWSRSVA